MVNGELYIYQPKKVLLQTTMEKAILIISNIHSKNLNQTKKKKKSSKWIKCK